MDTVAPKVSIHVNLPTLEVYAYYMYIYIYTFMLKGENKKERKVFFFRIGERERNRGGCSLRSGNLYFFSLFGEGVNVPFQVIFESLTNQVELLDKERIPAMVGGDLI